MNKTNDLDLRLRVGVFDIETTGLDAKYGYALCIGAKEVNKQGTGKTFMLRIDDERNPNKFSDKWLIKEGKKLLDSFDLLVGWNSSGFDFPFLNSRALKHGLLPPQRNYRRDILFVARGNGRLGSNSLKSWDGYLNGKALKTLTTPEIHWASIRGDKKALNFIVKHCALDLISTESVYKKLMPLLGKLKKKG